MVRSSAGLPVTMHGQRRQSQRDHIFGAPARSAGRRPRLRRQRATSGTSVCRLPSTGKSARMPGEACTILLAVAGDPILHLSIPVGDLSTARQFYESVLGCRIGRVRDDWLDAWFFGLQLTLQESPDEVRPAEEQGVRHLGVVLQDREGFDRIVERVRSGGGKWLTEPETHTGAALSGKVGGKLADPSGNIIEIKFYGDQAEFLG